jgi:transcription factor TFIIIB component B''
MAINTDSVVKVPQPRRKSGRKKKEVAEGDPSPGDGTVEKKKTRKSTRSKKSQSTEDVSVSGAEMQPDGPVENGVHVDSTEPAVEPSGTKRKRRSSSDPRRSRKSRGPSHPPFNPDADPGEELDPTVVTMAALCSDTGQGRISSKAVQIQNNHAAWKASNREKRARMKMLMESKKYGKKEGAEEVVTGGRTVDAPPAENPVSGNAAAGPSHHPANGSVRAPSAGPPPEDETGQGFDYSQSMSTSRFNVQVRIGPNGETIIDEESLFVDRVDENETVNYTHVEESDTTKFVNSSTYGKKFRGSRWSAEETELFFDVSLFLEKDWF